MIVALRRLRLQSSSLLDEQVCKLNLRAADNRPQSGRPANGFLKRRCSDEGLPRRAAGISNKPVDRK